MAGLDGAGEGVSARAPLGKVEGVAAGRPADVLPRADASALDKDRWMLIHAAGHSYGPFGSEAEAQEWRLDGFRVVAPPAAVTGGGRPS